MKNVIDYINDRLGPVIADIDNLRQPAFGVYDDEDITSRKHALNVAYAIRAVLIEIKLMIIEEMKHEETRYKG